MTNRCRIHVSFFFVCVSSCCCLDGAVMMESVVPLGRLSVFVSTVFLVVSVTSFP